jgi:hypothetical protein
MDLTSIHFLCCAHRNKHTRTHDAIRNTFVAIAQYVGFHMEQEQVHVFPSTMSNSSCWQVDIVLTKNEIRTLLNVVITNPTWVGLLFRSCAI